MEDPLVRVWVCVGKSKPLTSHHVFPFDENCKQHFILMKMEKRIKLGRLENQRQCFQKKCLKIYLISKDIGKTLVKGKF